MKAVTQHQSESAYKMSKDSTQIPFDCSPGKITLYWNRKGWFLIFLSIVDKNIKITTICI